METPPGLGCSRGQIASRQPGELQSWGRAPAENDKKGGRYDRSRWRVLPSQSQMPALVSSEMVVGGQGAIALLGHWPRASKPGPGWTSIYRDKSMTAKHPRHRQDERADAAMVVES